ncbi:transposable element Tcb2 transposase [Trichonephila clavipes]|nr:transposable element Tcb2 transposase [Trichonephila clavipes]
MAPRSPDLTPADFWLWGYLKSRVYLSGPSSLLELKDAIRREVSSIHPDMLHSAVAGFVTRLECLLPCGGGHVEHILVIWNRFLETGSAGRRPGQGRRRATTPNEDRYLLLTARRDQNMNAILLQQHLRSATGTTVSIQSVRNRLHGVEHVNWRRNEWSNVLFSDESRFSVHPDNRRIFIWRDRGSRNNPAFVHEIVRFGGRGVLVYGGISIDGRTDLYIIRDGPLTARRYRDEILRPIVVPYTAAIGDDFILMDDNCRPHRANLVEDFLFEEGIVRM